MKKVLLILGVIALVASLVGNVILCKKQMSETPINSIDTVFLPIDTFLCKQSADSTKFLLTKDGCMHFNAVNRSEIADIVPNHIIGVSVDIWTDEETNSNFGGLYWGFFKLDTIINGDYLFKLHQVDLPDDFCPF